MWMCLYEVVVIVESSHHSKKFCKSHFMITYENMINYLLKWSAKPESAQYAPDCRAMGLTLKAFYVLCNVISKCIEISQ